MKIAKEMFIHGFLILLMSGTFISMAQKSENNLGIKEDTAYARAMTEKALNYVSIAKFDSAVVFYKKACEIYKQYNITEKYSKSLNYISEQYIRMGNLADATVYATKALNESFRDSILHEIGKSYNNLGTISAYKGYSDSSVFYYEKALHYWLQEETDDKTPIVVIYTNMGVFSRILGDFEKSLKYSNMAIQVLNTCSENMDEYLSHNYNNLGTIYSQTGKYEEAITYFNKAMELWMVKYNGAHQLIATIYNNLGSIAQQTGDYDQALIYFQKALSTYKETIGEMNMNVADCHSNIGMVYLTMDKYSNALNEMNHALDIYKRINPEHPNLVMAYKNFSSIYSKHQDFDSALFYLEKSRNIIIKTAPDHYQNIALCDLSIGVNYFSKKDYKKALYYYNLAANGFINILDTKNPFLAKTYNETGKVFFEMCDFDQALYYYQLAMIANNEHFNDTTIWMNPNFDNIFHEAILLATFKEKAQTLYAQYNKYQDSLSYLRAAFKTSEKAIQLLGIMRNEYKTENSKVFLNKQNFIIFSMAVKYALVLYEITGEELYLQKAFEFAEKSRYAVLHASLMNLKAQHIAGIPIVLQQQERDLKLDLNFYSNLIDEEKDKDQPNSKKIDLWQNKIFQLNKTHDSLISTFESMFPEYYDLKYNYDVSDIKTIQSNLSEKEVLIEYTLSDSALIYFVITKSTADLISKKIDSSFYSNIDSLRNFLVFKNTANNSSFKYHQIAYDLYAKLLLPIEGIIDGKDLIIIPVGKLGTIPFESLATSPPEKNSSGFKSIPYSIKKHAISYGYSATILVNSLQEGKRRAKKKLVAFAPSFAEDNQDLVIELSERGNEYVSLSGAKEEVKSIMQLMSGRLYTDSLATERNFKENSSDYKILHIATHGILNDHDPMMTRLVFYQNSDSIEDGNLYAYEIYNMQLNADLAVLSACNTGSGKLQEGEGIMNLARGFLYAGVPGIVMSLWNVNDLSSAEIMKGFYSYLTSGSSKSEALQRAKINYLENSDNITANPYYWAGFVIIGNQHEISFKSKASCWIVIASSFFILLLVYLIRKRFIKKK